MVVESMLSVSDRQQTEKDRRELGEGTVFTVLLPWTSKRLGRVAESGSVAARGKERILYDDAIARLGKFGLQSLGYGVTSSTSSADALAAFAKSPGAFDIIVSDAMMPGTIELENFSRFGGSFQ